MFKTIILYIFRNNFGKTHSLTFEKYFLVYENHLLILENDFFFAYYKISSITLYINIIPLHPLVLFRFNLELVMNNYKHAQSSLPDILCSSELFTRVKWRIFLFTETH